MPRYYEFASGNNGLQPNGQPIWRHTIALCLEGIEHPVAFSEDIGHGGTGACFTASTALTGDWRKHYEIAGGQWLLPYVEKLARGEAVHESDVLAHYQVLHSHLPVHYDW
jgi:hypothetical protein